MLMLLFYAGDERFACSCDPIVEILPHVELKPILHTPNSIRGTLNYGGTPVAVVDWCQLILDRPCENALHSRVVIFKFESHKGQENLLGFMAEKITQTVDYKLDQFVKSGIQIEGLPFLEGVHTDTSGSIQYVDMEKLYDSVENVLFKE